MEWKVLEITTTQWGDSWKRTTLVELRLLSITIFRVEHLTHINGMECESVWEFTDRGNALVKYREVR